MKKGSLIQLFTPSLFTAFQQKLFISILAKLPFNNKQEKIRIQFKASSLFSEIEEKLSYDELQKQMFFLIKKTYSVDTSNQLIQINLLSKVSFIKGKGIIEIEINSSIIPYLYELRKVFSLNTLRYILNFKSIYAINIYLLLEQVKNGENITYSIDILKSILGINDKYKDYNTFKKRVILQAQKELHLTDKAFLFQEKKDNRRITEITFNIYPFEDLYCPSYRKKIIKKLINDLKISEIQANKIAFQFVEEEIRIILYQIKEKERAGEIMINIGVYSIAFFKKMGSKAL